MNYTIIKGTGHALPEKIVTNQDLTTLVDTTDEWIVERTGIRQRHVITHETTTSMGTLAAQRALEMAGWSATDLDLIIVATSTPDQCFPSTACGIQVALGARQIGAMDLQAACTGFVYALSVADQFIRAGTVRRVLVVGSESFSRLVDWSDRSTCVIFGDGAGAVVLEASDAPGILGTYLYSDGTYADLLYADNCYQTTDKNQTSERPHVFMQGNKVFKLAVSRLGSLVETTLAAHQLTPADIDWLIPHQANIRIMQAAADKLSLPWSKVICTVDRHANTSAASIPLALDVAVRDGRIQRGQHLLLESFGAGLTWGSALVRF